MDTFTFVEHGSMDMLFLTGRTARQFARIEDPVLLNREAAAELAQAVITIRAKFSPESPIAVNGERHAHAVAELPSQVLGSDELLSYLREHGPLGLGALVDALGMGEKTLGNRLQVLRRKGLARSVGGVWAASTAAPSVASSREVEDWLITDGPKSYEQIRDHFGFDTQKIANRIWYLRNTGRIVETGDMIHAVADSVSEPEPERRAVTSQVLRDYIAEHPGLTKAQLVQALDASHESVKRALDNLRRRDHFHVDPETGGYLPGPGPKLTKQQTQRLSVITRPQYQPEESSGGDLVPPTPQP